MKEKKPVGPPKATGPRVIDLRNQVYTGQTKKTGINKENTSFIPANPAQAVRKNRTKQWIKLLVILISLLLIGSGLYILLLLLMPIISRPSEKSVRAQAEVVIQNKNQVFIPSVGIQSEIKEGGIEILDQGVVWHRLPERGNPEKGGNFILTGHSFVWGYTPQKVTKQSVFYHLGEAKEGDEIIVHWNNKKYTYVVKEKQTVKPNATEVEKMSNKPKLTIYTCTTGGASDGRIVIIAEPKQ
jgi:sortase A